MSRIIISIIVILIVLSFFILDEVNDYKIVSSAPTTSGDVVDDHSVSDERPTSGEQPVSDPFVYSPTTSEFYDSGKFKTAEPPYSSSLSPFIENIQTGFRVVLAKDVDKSILLPIGNYSKNYGMTPSIVNEGGQWLLFLGPYPTKEEASEMVQYFQRFDIKIVKHGSTDPIATLPDTPLDKTIQVNPEYIPAKTILVDDMSIAGSLRSNVKQPCGKFSIKLQVEEIDELEYEHVVITDERGDKFNSINGRSIAAIVCADLNGDEEPELFLHFWQGGRTHSAHVYLLESPIKLVFEHNYYTNEFVDLNNDGLMEISSFYPFRYFGGLCGACSPGIKRIFCFKEGRFDDCSSKFPDFLKWKIANSKKALTSELEKVSGDTIKQFEESELSEVQAHALEMLAYATLLEKEEKAIAYLREVLPPIVYGWLLGLDSEVYSRIRYPTY
jgi:hypothetical protein